MNKSILLLIPFIIFSCFNQNSSQKAKNDESDEKKQESNLEKFPASKYFEIVNFNKARFVDKCTFEAEIELLNKSEYKFSKFELYSTLNFLTKDGFECETAIQRDAYKPNKIVDWEPNTTRIISFSSLGTGFYGGCGIGYDRTPEGIIITFKADAISIDKEIYDNFARYNLLPQWKEKQALDGLR